MVVMYPSKKFLARKVHIVPLGFEYERIIEPLLMNKADKVWLVLHYDDQYEEEFLVPIINRLKKLF